MGYGWGYRGTVGHEAGAMVPGALLGLALCLGSPRLDWHRRAAVAGLFGAIGWAWGGSFSYMEHTLYALSDSFVDVLYGYAMLFLLGGLWAGIGGGVLGLALTGPRSYLERLIRPFTVVCVAFLLVYLYAAVMPAHKEAVETLTVRSFHNTDWLAATIVLVVSAGYAAIRPQDRPGAALLFWGAVAWWVGYLGFTKFGGLRLAPLHRNENWGGIVGVLIVLLIHLVKRRNRAALMLCLYGILGGGLAFALAVFIRHPFAVQWGPFEGRWPQWRMAEVTFGFLMGFAVALGTHRLICGGLAPPREDGPRAPLDVYAVFVILVALVWINFRRHVAPSVAKSAAGTAPFLGIPFQWWCIVAGGLATAPLLYALTRYLRGDRQLTPASPFGKGAAVTLMLIWVTVAGYTFHEPPTGASVLSHLLLWVPAGLASWLLVSFTPAAAHATVPDEPTYSASDPRWSVGVRYALVWAATPLILVGITGLSTAMQDGPLEGAGRKRFGPEAYWRQTARLMGAWQAVGRTSSPKDEIMFTQDLPVTRLEFDQNRNVTAVAPSGETDSSHQWFLKNQYTWLRWRGKLPDHPERAEVPLEFRDSRLYVAWPPYTQREGYLVFERAADTAAP